MALTTVPEVVVPKPLPCRSNIPWMLWWIACVHISWAFGLAFGPALLNNVVALIGIDWIRKLGFSPINLSILLLVTSGLAIAGLVKENRIMKVQPPYGWIVLLFTLGPQYFIVIAAAISDLWLLTNAHYNGQDVNRWVLLSVLAPVIWGAAMHTGQILERYANTWRH